LFGFFFRERKGFETMSFIPSLDGMQLQNAAWQQHTDGHDYNRNVVASAFTMMNQQHGESLNTRFFPSMLPYQRKNPITSTNVSNFLQNSNYRNDDATIFNDRIEGGGYLQRKRNEDLSTLNTEYSANDRKASLRLHDLLAGRQIHDINYNTTVMAEKVSQNASHTQGSYRQNQADMLSTEQMVTSKLLSRSVSLLNRRRKAKLNMMRNVQPEADAFSRTTDEYTMSLPHGYGSSRFDSFDYGFPHSTRSYKHTSVAPVLETQKSKTRAASGIVSDVINPHVGQPSSTTFYQPASNIPLSILQLHHDERIASCKHNLISNNRQLENERMWESCLGKISPNDINASEKLFLVSSLLNKKYGSDLDQLAQKAFHMPIETNLQTAKNERMSFDYPSINNTRYAVMRPEDSSTCQRTELSKETNEKIEESVKSADVQGKSKAQGRNVQADQHASLILTSKENRNYFASDPRSSEMRVPARFCTKIHPKGNVDQSMSPSKDASDCTSTKCTNNDIATIGRDTNINTREGDQNCKSKLASNYIIQSQVNIVTPTTKPSDDCKLETDGTFIPNQVFDESTEEYEAALVLQCLYESLSTPATSQSYINRTEEEEIVRKLECRTSAGRQDVSVRDTEVETSKLSLAPTNGKRKRGRPPKTELDAWTKIQQVSCHSTNIPDMKDQLPPWEMLVPSDSVFSRIEDRDYLYMADDDSYDDNRKQRKLTSQERKRNISLSGKVGSFVDPSFDGLFVAMAQMIPCQLTTDDQNCGITSYKNLPLGFQGLACRHCNGRPGSGRYFPSTVRCLSQTTTAQNMIKHFINASVIVPDKNGRQNNTDIANVINPGIDTSVNGAKSGKSYCTKCPYSVWLWLTEFQKRLVDSKDGVRQQNDVADTSQGNCHRVRYGARKVFYEKIWKCINDQDPTLPNKGDFDACN
jgi:hypothetical protein